MSGLRLPYLSHQPKVLSNDHGRRHFPTYRSKYSKARLSASRFCQYQESAQWETPSYFRP